MAPWQRLRALTAGPSPEAFHFQLLSLGMWLGISSSIKPRKPSLFSLLSPRVPLCLGRVWVEARDGFMKSEDSSGPSECQGTVNGAQCLPRRKAFSF